jgi:hypothetical protein
MLVVAAGSLLPSVEDWFGARTSCGLIQPLLDELGDDIPTSASGASPRPLVFRVAERMSLISDALFLEATRRAARRRPVDAPARRGPRLSSTPTCRLDAPRGAGGTGARDRGVDLRRRGEPTRRQAALFPVWLVAPADHVFGPGVDPRPSPSSIGSSTGRMSRRS